MFLYVVAKKSLYLHTQKEIVFFNNNQNMATIEFSEVFSKRLMNARKMRKMSQKALADALKGLVSASAIEKYEKGLMLPNSTVMIALERVLGLDSDYFFTPISESSSSRSQTP